MEPLELVLSDDGKTFAIQTSDVVVTTDAAELLRVLPDEVKASLRTTIDARIETVTEERDLEEGARASALERRKARDAELASLEAVAATLPDPPEPTAGPDSPQTPP